VFGAGKADARVMLIGEQPGDAEDRAGQPFVGPAGKLLDRALAEAGIAPEITYTTNATRLSPDVVVTLGAIAGRALFGSSFRVTQQRGTEVAWCAPASGGKEREITVVPTIHPSAVLRADDRDAAYRGLVSDLRVAADLVQGAAGR
jgi:uracil-DNA glycosylase